MVLINIMINFIERKYIYEIFCIVYAICSFLFGYFSKIQSIFVIGIFFILLTLLKIELMLFDKKNKDNNSDEDYVYKRSLYKCRRFGSLLLPFGLLIIITTVQMLEKEINYNIPLHVLIISSFFFIFFFLYFIVNSVSSYKNKTVLKFTSNAIILLATISSCYVFVFALINTIFKQFDTKINGIVGCVFGLMIIIFSLYMLFYQGKNDETLKDLRIKKVHLKQKKFFTIVFALILLSLTILLTVYKVFDVTDNLLVVLLTNNQKRMIPLWLESSTYGLCIFCTYILLNYHEKRLSTIINIVLLVASYSCIIIFALSGYHFHFFGLLVCFSIMFTVFMIQEVILSKLKNKKTEKALNMYVDSNVVEELSKVEEMKMTRSTSNKEIAVMFIDVRGFTSFTEKNSPEVVVKELNVYFEYATNIIQKWGGTLDKYIGDAIMAVFNSPIDLEDYLYKSVCCGLEIIKVCKENNVKYQLGIGINCGNAIVGNIGSKKHMDYTAIGDTVNTASRLESNADANQLLISENVKNKLGNRFDYEYIGDLKLKGKENLVKTYSVKEKGV